MSGKLHTFSSELEFLGIKHYRQAGLTNMSGVSADYWCHIAVVIGCFSVTSHCQLELQMCAKLHIV